MNTPPKFYILIAIILLVVFLLIKHYHKEPDQNLNTFTVQNKKPGANTPLSPKSEFDINPEAGSSIGLGSLSNQFNIFKVKIIDPNTKFDQRPIPSHPDFFHPTGATAKRVIKNNAGKTIFQATEELPFISLRSMKGVDKVVVHSGEGRSFLINTESGNQVKLPDKPPGENMFPLWWEWVDPDTLLGISGVQSLNSDGMPVTCCGGHNVAETKLYTYKLSSSELAELELPKKVAGKAFEIQPPTRDGSFQATSIQTHDGSAEESIWLQLQTD